VYYSIKLPEHDGAFVRKCGNWKLYHDYLEKEKIAVYKENYLVRLPQLSEKKVGRNEPCPCASGKKYKKCCISKTKG